MPNKVEVGKYTLESLTTGMYEQPLIIYREYIQNAVDSLEDAVDQDILDPVHMHINISVDAYKKSIEILDNGTGITSDKASRVLLSVGASTKQFEVSRGFRGIGRLGGLSYCEELIFETTAYGDKKTTCVVFNCKKLKKLLLPGKSDGLSMEDVISSVSEIQYHEAKEEDHFFVVRMAGVDDESGLLDIAEVEEYLSQTAPVAFDPKFFLSKKIKKFLEDRGIVISEVPIFLNSNGQSKPIYKANKRHYKAGRNDSTVNVYDIKFFEVTSPSGDIVSLGWFADNDWLGTIHDNAIKGLRLRKGNILIGDGRTLNSIFKQSRFNGWTQGEVYIVSNKFIPNARRDNFEQNEEFHFLMNALKEGVGSEISSLIGEASRTRNNPEKRKIKAAKRIINDTSKAIDAGFNSKAELVFTQDKLIDTLDSISSMKEKSNEEVNEVYSELEKLITDIDEHSNLKIDKFKGAFSRKEKRLLQIVTDTLTEYLDKMLLDQIVNEILEQLIIKGKE